jgi:type VI secretion system protein ImpG
MDRRLLNHYNNELKFMQQMGAEFAHSFPKVAARLGIENEQCADPYVERLLEGFAFLTARVQLKIEEEFPKFCQQILSMVYPDYLAPMPSMTVVQIVPDPGDTSTADGFVLERGSRLRSGLSADMQTSCEYTTAQEVTLYPLEVKSVEYLGNRAALSHLGIKPGREVAAGVRIDVDTLGGIGLEEIDLDELPLFLAGTGHIPLWLYEQVLSNGCGLSIVTGGKDDRRAYDLPATNIRRMGFDSSEALLNYRSRSFEGYRLLREYFAFPDRYRFINFCGLREALAGAKGEHFEIVVHLSQRRSELENVVDKNNFLPFCTPAVNIFPKRADRVHIDDREFEYHVVPDRSKPLDYEVYQVLGVTGYGAQAQDSQKFRAFYGMTDTVPTSEQMAFYTVQRKPRIMSSRQRAQGMRSAYLGSEVFVSLVDASEAPYSPDLDQLGMKTLCTNRDLPMLMPLGQKGGDFTLEVNAPVEAIRCVAGPTRPGVASSTGDPGELTTTGDYAWRVISHLSLNYLSLIDENPDEGAAALRELLSLYSNYSTLSDRQINGIRSIEARPMTCRLPIPGPISFGRGLEIEVMLEEAAFEAGGMYLFGSVLEEFFSKYVSVNNLTETVVRSDRDIEIARWPVRMGTRPRL